jgi:small subunit ribosomal protein S20
MPKSASTKQFLPRFPTQFFVMANSRSAAKRVRKTRTETARNRVTRIRVKTSRRQVTDAIEAGKASEAAELLEKFSSVVDKAATKNIVHKNAAARQKATLSRRIKAVAAG